MVTASLYGTLRIIFILILVFYAIKFLLRIFAPVIIDQVVKKAGQNLYEQQQNNQAKQAQQNPKQHTVFSSGNTDMPREKKKVGEYIDYEEL